MVERDENRTDDLPSDDRSAPHILQHRREAHVSPVPQYFVAYQSAQLPETLVRDLHGVRDEAQETGD